ncbi:hypothetical protein AURDEDRAFT_181749 [Auricularia subglabra TFB-10046 SS5]|nr:hypothetical protein AURDEDRAFT_181749 [Auricularia subglabra TFB-10046 SS5]
MEANGDADGQYEYPPQPDPNTLPSLHHQTEPAQHPAAASEPAKPKRAHVQAACIFCKGRKMRCDGAKPSCANCVNRKLACEYPEPPARARAPRASNGSPTPSKRKQQQQQPQQQRPPPDAPMLPVQYYPPRQNGAPPHPIYYYPIGHDGNPLPPHLAHPYYHMPQPPPPQPPRQRGKRAASEMEGEDDGGAADGDYNAHASTASNGSAGAKKRTGKRATMACHSCRSRKLKCDESMPACSQCQRRNLPCAYDDQVRRRGPSKRKRSNEADGPSPEPQPAPPHAHTHPLGVIPIPGPDGTKFMQMVDQNGVPVHYMVTIDPNTQQIVPVHAPDMHLAGGEDAENGGGDGSPHTTNGLSPHTQDGDDLAEQHPAAPPVIWS